MTRLIDALKSVAISAVAITVAMDPDTDPDLGSRLLWIAGGATLLAIYELVRAAIAR